MNVQLPGNVAICCQLCNQHPQVITSNSIGTPVQDEPGTANSIIQSDVESVLKLCRPIGSARSPDCIDRIFTIGQWFVDANGQPAVKGQIRIGCVQSRIDILRQQGPQFILIPVCGGNQFQCIQVISIYRRHKVRGIFSCRIETIGHHPLQGAGCVHLDCVNLQAIHGRLFVCTGTKITSTILFGSNIRKIAGIGFRATFYFKFIADTIFIFIIQARSIAIDIILRIDARTIIRIC